MTSSDIDVAFAEGGRILALGKGKTVITVKYGSFSKEILVSVKKKIDLIADVKENQKNIDYLNTPSSESSDIGIMSLTSSERSRINSLCLQMMATYWTPTQNLLGYGGGYYFTSGTSYVGIPYTRYIQKDRAGFLAAMNYSDFYTPYTTSSGTKMPRYGNDCSGFTSIAWEIPRIDSATFIQRVQNGTYPKVGSYNAYNPDYFDLFFSYYDLQTGDAVVHSGHVFIIAVNYTSQGKLQCFEQAGPTCNITYWYYNNLAQLSYMPFSRN